jgi:maltose-binding protein MalE
MPEIPADPKHDRDLGRIGRGRTGIPALGHQEVDVVCEFDAPVALACADLAGQEARDRHAGVRPFVRAPAAGLHAVQHVAGREDAMDAEVMAYRADLFEAAGLTEAPRTWDEFRSYAEKLNQPEKGIYGVVTMPGEQDAGYSEWTVRLASLPMPPDANQFVWNKSFKSALTYEGNAKKALDLWLDIKPFVAPGANEMGYAESTNAFMQGNGAMFINWYMTFSDVENPETSKVVGKVKYALPPRNSLEGQRHDYLGGFQIAIAANAQQPAAAATRVQARRSRKRTRRSTSS